MTSEANFQSYFLKTVKHGYRTAVTGSPGFPDVLLIHEALHSFVELKVLRLGVSGDRKLGGLFKKTQPPWYANYLAKGGNRLYVVFRLENSYGILRVTREFVRDIEVVQYAELKRRYDYREYQTLKELLHDHFE